MFQYWLCRDGIHTLIGDMLFEVLLICVGPIGLGAI